MVERAICVDHRVLKQAIGINRRDRIFQKLHSREKINMFFTMLHQEILDDKSAEVDF
jgi:hypothetical protein